MGENLIDFRGRRVLDGWPELLAESQRTTHVTVGGRRLPRVRYGEEADDWSAGNRPCHDCAAVAGEFHVVGCDVERCPACGGQALSCDCTDSAPDAEPGAAADGGGM